MRIKDSLVVQVMTVAEGVLYLPVVGMSEHRTPLALALDDLFRDGPGGIRTHNNDVGLIPFPDEPAFADLKQLRRMMAHQLYQSFNRQDTCVHQFQHGDQRELYHRHARCGLGCPTLLVA